MTDTELSKVETDAKADLEHVKATLASDELKAKTDIESLWTRYEVYIVAVLCLGIGFMVGHLLK